MKTTRSEALFARAQALIPGGVNSPVRAFRGVGGVPLFIARADGSRVFDVDGNSFIDYVGSWGPMLLGHRPPVIEAPREALEIGTSFGAPTEREIEMAEPFAMPFLPWKWCGWSIPARRPPCARLRVARGFTGRDLTVKFEGCYHGHVDSLLVKAGSGLATLASPIRRRARKALPILRCRCPSIRSMPWNAAFRAHGGQIASVIVEPVVGNMGCVPPQPGFLEALREMTARHGALLILDEVMTGFRLALGGAQQTLRHPARYDHARQNHRRRLAHRRL